MLTVRRASSTSRGSTIRLSWAQSTATSTRSAVSCGADRASPCASRPRKWYSPGSGAGPPRTITDSLPSASSARCVARSEPIASPSGLSWEVTTNRSFARSASTTASRSALIGLIQGWLLLGRRELVDELGHAHPLFDRPVVDELEVRRPPQLELAIDRRLQHARGTGERLERPLTLLLRAEHAEPDLRVVEVARRLDRRDGHEPDPRVLERRDRLGDDLLHRPVDPPHPLGPAHWSETTSSGLWRASLPKSRLAWRTGAPAVIAGTATRQSEIPRSVSPAARQARKRAAARSNASSPSSGRSVKPSSVLRNSSARRSSRAPASISATTTSVTPTSSLSRRALWRRCTGLPVALRSSSQADVSTTITAARLRRRASRRGLPPSRSLRAPAPAHVDRRRPQACAGGRSRSPPASS